METEDDDREQAIEALKDDLANRDTLYIDDVGNLSLIDEEDSVFGEAVEAGIGAELVVSLMTDAILSAIPDSFDGVSLRSGGMGSGQWPSIDPGRVQELARLMPGWTFLGDGYDDEDDEGEDAS